MRVSVTAKLAMLTGLLLAATPSMAQQKPAQTWTVYVAALKGECRGDVNLAIVNGRAVTMPTRPTTRVSSNDEQPLLTRFEDDPEVRAEVEREMGKQSGLRVVSTPAAADFVLCFCSQYWATPPFANRPSRMPDDAGRRVLTEARAIGVESWLNSPTDPRPWAKTSFWHDST